MSSSGATAFKTRALQASILLLCTVAFITVQLAWQWWHGGIQSHHLLANPDLPAVSNAWGLLILPALAWGVRWRLQQGSNRVVWYALIAAFCYGGLLAVLFLTGVQQPLAFLFFGTYVLALFLPLYRPEIVLGYVAALSIAFGAVLPLVMSSPAILIAWLAAKARHWLLRRKLLPVSSDTE